MAEARITLRGVSSQVEGLQWEFARAVRIGRDPRMELVIQHPTVSPQHAEVVATRHGWIVRDLGSTRGTSVNGVRVATRERLVQPGDLLQIGSCTLRVAALEQPPPELLTPARAAQAGVKTTQAFMTIQTSTQRSWEQGLEALAGHDDARLPQGRHFLTLLRGGYHLSRVTSLDEMLRSVLEDTVAVMDAQRGAFLLLDAASGELRLRCSISADANGPVFSRTLGQRSFRKGESLLCQDANADADLKKSGEAAQGGMASIICALLRSPRQRLGILHLDRGPGQPQFTSDDVHLADAIAASLSVGVECALAVERHHEQTVSELTSVMRRLLGLLDPSGEQRRKRVSALALLMAEQVGRPRSERRALETAVWFSGFERALSASATSEESAAAVDWDATLKCSNDLANVIPILRGRSERWDGSGVPDGLAGDAIPLGARILAVAQAYDAMVSGVGGSAAVSSEQAIEMLRKLSGVQFDESCVEALASARAGAEAVYVQTPAVSSRAMADRAASF
jgi:pSer/pThr/pTyr-binding forkhead associated (FHA) protein